LAPLTLCQPRRVVQQLPTCVEAQDEHSAPSSGLSYVPSALVQSGLTPFITSRLAKVCRRPCQVKSSIWAPSMAGSNR